MFFFLFYWLVLSVFINFINLLKEPNLGFINFLYCFLISIPIFIMYFLLITLDLIHSSFSSFLKWKHKLLKFNFVFSSISLWSYKFSCSVYCFMNPIHFINYTFIFIQLKLLPNFPSDLFFNSNYVGVLFKSQILGIF